MSPVGAAPSRPVATAPEPADVTQGSKAPASSSVARAAPLKVYEKRKPTKKLQTTRQKDTEIKSLVLGTLGLDVTKCLAEITGEGGSVVQGSQKAASRRYIFFGFSNFSICM